jgi:hypothetical protein
VDPKAVELQNIVVSNNKPAQYASGNDSQAKTMNGTGHQLDATHV